MLEVLSKDAGVDPLQDRFRTGYIAAIDDLLQVSFEEIEQQ